MTHGMASNDKYRAATASLSTSASTRRATCTSCARISSIGQFPIGSDVCVRCKPMAAGWRRGQL